MNASPINKLPQELRDHIYELALYHPEGIAIPQTDVDKALPQGPLHARAPTRICSQMRKDCLGIFYAINTFCFPLIIGAHRPMSKAMAAWLSMVGPTARSSLRKVEVPTQGWIQVQPFIPFVKDVLALQVVMEVRAKDSVIFINVKNCAAFDEHGEKTIELCIPVLYALANPNLPQEIYGPSVACADSAEEAAQNDLMSKSIMCAMDRSMMRMTLVGELGYFRHFCDTISREYAKTKSTMLRQGISNIQ